MASHMRTSRAGLDVIKTYEGFRPRYQRLPDGRWIIGYGHVRGQRDGAMISESEAEALLREYDLPPVERLVSDCVMAPLNQNEFDALVSLALNLGPKAFVRSDVVAELNAGRRIEAAEAFDRWRHAKIADKIQVIDALVRRRAAEKALFLKAPGEMAVASSRIVRPLSDADIRPALPKPKEIIVERQALPPMDEDQDTRTAAPRRDALKEASESVRQQMIRILGEDGSNQADISETTDGASPEEITAAVSELVQGAESATGPVRSVWPSHEDLPPPPGFESEPGDDFVAPAAAAIPPVIDDLEQVEIDPESISRAVEVNAEVEAEDNGQHLKSVLPYASLSSLGLVVFGFGLAELLSGISEPKATGDLATYVPPVLVLLGGVLFATMAYYGVRVLMAPKR